MKFADNKNLYIRRALFALLIALTAAFQHTSGAIPSLLGARAMVLIPLTVCIAMFERSIGGLAFGAVAGILWDFAAVRGDGFFSVMLACVGFISGATVTYFMRNNIFSALIIGAGATTAVNVAYWLIFVLGKGFEGATSVLFSFYLPSALYSLAFIFLYYYLVDFTVKITSQSKTKKTY